MTHEVTVDFLLSGEESSSVVDTRQRPLRVLPDDRGFGINFRGEIYPLHSFDGVSGHVHLSGTQSFHPNSCPVFEGELLLENKTFIRGAIDFSARSKYLLFDCEEEALWTILNDLEEEGIQIGKFGPSVRPAANGRMYDHWARVTGWKRSASDLATLVVSIVESSDQFSIVIDDVIENPASDNVQSVTNRVQSPAVSEGPTPNNDLLVLSRTTDRLIQGLKSGGWSQHELDDLSERLAAHAVAAIDKKSELADSEWLEKVSNERAVVIGEWSRSKLRAIAEEALPKVESLESELRSARKHNGQLQVELEQIRLDTRVVEDGNSEDQAIEVDSLNRQLKEKTSELDEWLKDHDRTVREKEELESELQLTKSSLERMRRLTQAVGAGSEVIADFCAALLPRIELMLNSDSILADRLEDRSMILDILSTLNGGDSHPRGKSVVGARGWFEIRFSTGTGSDGRLYYKSENDRLRVILSQKGDQNHIIRRLKRL
jgi:hypothetical protein